ncbi:fumarylacetoacetate hydrolase family protein [Burkholderia gladioli pv. gladioli]|uniref:2-keto-4-pentenoate hydratase n=1 Tax=Burkholderia gladioli TaxID=28095 RepID=A0A095F3I3_BURGA|nr:fumarylacetoacetate hydrolase family protein [Burkholderia gladioli]AJX00369.1 fumarylacetoacetate (FAA) hydrolase family protein [Burkholderia gladioli]ASD79930.1 2-keto-4-pentenoate hydratase [Burkholderia gladioli pv. gladioli]AWY54828.1 2-keto-4-pentenoate hydratase [Burkholderia gladioli pv. gladioli]KGC11530.1 fumarylacetoacetate (FAA) hydrolase family protein [Burkholderia gladioli]MDJ1164173.1 fumarylacetoacetate hydrolase family protein [Burkholderia gladioli pv. gladioli]
MNDRYQLLSFNDAGCQRAGLLIGERVFPWSQRLGEALQIEMQERTVTELVTGWAEYGPQLREVATRINMAPGSIAGYSLDELELLAPLLPGTIYGAGANYHDHVAEMDRALGMPSSPDPRTVSGTPWHFIKAPSRSVVVGPGEPVTLPPYSGSVDWEAELAVVIGRAARNVSVDDALSYVAGYTVANDLSVRDAFVREYVGTHSPFHFDWIAQKCWEGSCPLGPWITPADDISDVQSLGIRLWLNGELRQDSSTAQMIFGIAEQIAFLSSRVGLYPGDVILSGTPAGVGMPHKHFIKPGDRIEVWIEHIGSLTTTFSAFGSAMTEQ